MPQTTLNTTTNPLKNTQVKAPQPFFMRLSPLARYGFAVGLTALAFAVSFLLQTFIADTRFLIFFIAVILSAWLFGFGPGIVSAALSVVLVDYFLTAPLYNLFVHPTQTINYVMYFGVAAFVSWLEHRRSIQELELRNARNQLEVILHAATDGISAQDRDGNFVFANNAAAKFAGFENADDMISMDVNKIRARFVMTSETGRILTGKDMPRNKVFEDGHTHSLTFHSHNEETKQDSWVHVTSAPVFNDKGEVTLVVNVMRDITVAKRAETDRFALMTLLEQQRLRVNNIISNVPGIIWEGSREADGTHHLDFINDHVEKMLGYTSEEIRAAPDSWQKITHPDDLEQLQAELTEIYNTGKAGNVQTRLIASDGRIVDAEVYKSVVVKADGKHNIYGAIMDISERKGYEQALAATAESLRRSNAELEQFAYVASHDLQEPLRMVTSYLQLIEQRYKDKLDDSGREFIGFAIDGASRMKSLINDLLSYSRVQRIKEEFEAVDMQSIVADVIRQFQFTIEDTGAVITHDTLPTLYGHDIQLKQLLQNLVGNAIKFAREDVTPVVHIGVQRQRRDWLFSVKDNGIGIEPQYLDRIFVIFQRLHSKGKYPGTGIGLAICKKVVENHQGRIWIESIPNEGSTFYFTIPAGRPTEKMTNDYVDH